MQNDLISRSALLDELQEELDFDTPMLDEEQNKLINTGLRIAVKDVKRQPAVDAVALEILEGKMLKAVMQKQDGVVVEFLPVVRCKDCRRCDGFPRKEIEPNEIGICRINRMAVKPDDYCSFGERKQGDTNG